MKKAISLILVFTFVFALFSISANAATRTVQDLGGGSISATNGSIGSSTGSSTANVSYGTSWELYAYYDSGKSIIRFGFDTGGTNEDYVYGFQKNAAHQATVSNSSHSTVSSSQASANTWTSKVDVVHAARPVWKLLY